MVHPNKRNLSIFIIVFLTSLLCIRCKQDKQITEVKVVQESLKKSDESNISTSEKKKILFFGDSLTAGYQLEEDESFPSIIQTIIDSLDLPYEVINGGLSGETTAGGKNRIDWVLKQAIDVFVLELGPNDVLRGFDLQVTEDNLTAIIDKVKLKHPNIPIVIAGMEAPPNLGKTYTDRFRGIYANLAKKYNTGLVPFLLDGVAGNPTLNLQDGMHPNANGQKIVANNVWNVLKKYL